MEKKTAAINQESLYPSEPNQITAPPIPSAVPAFRTDEVEVSEGQGDRRKVQMDGSSK